MSFCNKGNWFRLANGNFVFPNSSEKYMALKCGIIKPSLGLSSPMEGLNWTILVEDFCALYLHSIGSSEGQFAKSFRAGKLNVFVSVITQSGKIREEVLAYLFDLQEQAATKYWQPLSHAICGPFHSWFVAEYGSLVRSLFFRLGIRVLLVFARRTLLHAGLLRRSRLYCFPVVLKFFWDQLCLR